MTQPKALYLADILEDSGKPADIAESAAAELRQLHELAMEQQGRTYVLSMARSMEQKTAKLKRDALLSVLKEIVALWDHHCDAHGDGTPSPLHVKARVAIAKVEEKA